MKHWVFVVLCSTFCRAHYYSAGFPIDGDASACFCADRVPKSTPIPLELHLTLPPIFRESTILKDTRPFFRYDLDKEDEN